MSDLVALLVLGTLLGVLLLLGVVMVSVRRRQHQREEGDREV